MPKSECKVKRYLFKCLFKCHIIMTSHQLILGSKVRDDTNRMQGLPFTPALSSPGRAEVMTQGWHKHSTRLIVHPAFPTWRGKHTGNNTIQILTVKQSVLHQLTSQTYVFVFVCLCVMGGTGLDWRCLINRSSCKKVRKSTEEIIGCIQETSWTEV